MLYKKFRNFLSVEYKVALSKDLDIFRSLKSEVKTLSVGAGAVTADDNIIKTI